MLTEGGARRLIVVLGGFLCYLVADGCTFSAGVLFTEFLKVFHRSKAATAVLPGLMYAVPQLSGVLVCPFVETVGCALSAVLGGVILALSFFVSRFVLSFQLMYVSLGVVASLGLELTYVSGIMAVTKEFGEGKLLGLALGITVSGSGIGVFIFNPLLSYLISEYLWQGTMTIESAIFLNVIIAGCIFRLASRIHCPLKEKKAKVKIEIVKDFTTYHSIVRYPSQSHSAEALDIIKESYSNDDKVFAINKQFPHYDSEQRSSSFLSKTQTKYCEPFHKPIYSQHKSSSLDRRVSAGDAFSVKLPVDERAASFVRRLSLYSSQNIKGSSQNIKVSESHKVSQESMLSQPSLQIDSAENTSQINDSHIQSGYDAHLISVQSRKSSKCISFARNLKTSVLLLISGKIWSNISLILFYFATLMFATSVVVVWTFSYSNSINIGIDDGPASFLISIVGIGSCLGQIFFGYISDFCPAILLYSVGCIAAGLMTIILTHISAYWLLGIIHGLFGFFQGVSYALFSVILLHYTSVELYHASLALYLLFSGCGNLIGTSVAGYMNDMTGDFHLSYTAGGCILVLCGVIVFPMIFTWNRSDKGLHS